MLPLSENIVRRRWSILGLVVAGCSNPAVGSREALADPVHVETAIRLPAADSTDGAAGELPTVMFRCEAGTVEAYVVTESRDTRPSADQMVRIDLDSAPGC